MTSTPLVEEIIYRGYSEAFPDPNLSTRRMKWLASALREDK
jgi:hypothetical protein